MTIELARTEEEIELVRILFRQYRERIRVDLSFQDFEREVASLPGEYAHPRGCLLLYRDRAAALGCVGVRPWSEGICELKRLYVRDYARGRGAGRALAERGLNEARRRGFTVMRLDTLPTMKAAMELHQLLGFVEIPPYRFNPVPGARFFELALGPAVRMVSESQSHSIEASRIGSACAGHVVG